MKEMTRELTAHEARLLGNRPKRLIAVAIGALLTGLCLVFPVIGLAEWVTLVPVMAFLLVLASDGRLRLRALYAYGLLFFMVYYLTIYHWFINLYPLDFVGDVSKGTALFVVLFSWIGLSLFQACQGAFVFVLGGLLFRTVLLKKYAILKPLTVAALWAVYEWWQTVGWFGVPWGRLPLGQIQYLVGLQTVSWFGTYFVTFLLVSVNGLLALMILERAWLRTAAISVAGILLFQYGAGTALWLSFRDEGEPISVAAAQGNISSHEKWDSTIGPRIKGIYERLTAEAVENGATLVVWPETAIPYTMREGGSHWKYASELAKKYNVTILVGAFREAEGTTTSEYNALFCFLPDGSMSEEIYLKRRPVPFGEFVPLKPLVETLTPAMADLVLSVGDILPGEEAVVIPTDQAVLGNLICFDSIYDELARESVLAGAEVLCLSTNDSWFTYSVALDMHNAQAQLRAMETGRYLVRAANTGISTILSPRGEILDSREPLVEGLVEGEVYARDSLTLYTRTGNVFVVLCAVGLVTVPAFEVIKKIRARKKNNEEK